MCDLENPPHKLDGESLVPLMEAAEVPTERFSVTMFGPGNGSLRTDRWRFIRYADGSEELYDMRRDPQEWVNLVSMSANREILRDLRSKLKPFLLPSGKP